MSPEERKRTFVEVAIRLFFENGVESTTMQQIAKEAGVSYGLFYHYFRSKDDLLTAAVDQLSKENVIGDLLSNHDVSLKEQLCRLSETYLQLMESQREIIWLFLSESRKRPALEQRLHAAGQDMRRHLCDYLKARQDLGEVRQGLDLDTAARFLYSHLFLRHLWNEPDLSPIETVVDVLLQGVQA